MRRTGGRPGPVRLLYWAEFHWPTIGGIETYALQFIPALRDVGYEITVITTLQHDYSEEETHDGTVIHRLPFHEVLRARDPEAFIKLRRQVAAVWNDFAPDVIHANLCGPSIALHLETNRRAKVPTVIAIHSDFTAAGGMGNIVRRSLDQAAWVTAVSKATLGDIRSLFPQIGDKSSCIYNGLATGNVTPRPLSADPPRVLCISRLIEGKGFDIALDAFARIRGSFPDAILTIAGDGPEGPALQRQADALGLGQSVVFAGWVEPDAVYDLISQSTVMLVPSRVRETFGLVAIEAALMARPVIAARIGGLEEVVIDGKTGFLVDKEDPQALADRLGEILSQPELAARLGRNARADTIERFSLDANVAAYDALYRRVLAASAA